MKTRRVPTYIAWVSCALAACPGAYGQSNPPASEREVLVRVVTQWNDACSGSRRTSWDDMVRAWYNEITDGDAAPGGHGNRAWVADGFYQNGNMVDSDFTDPDLVAWGNDDGNDRLDDVDVAMLAFHGKDANGSRWYGKMRVNEAGGGDCKAEQDHIQLGDTDLEFLHLSSCESMNEESWWPEWSDSFAGLHQIDGFHGLMWISGSYNDRYRDFADDAFDMSIADAWIDNHYDPAHWYEAQSYDHCPVARGVGTGEEDCDDRMSNERYDHVYSDIAAEDIGFDEVIYISGCDPKSEGALP
ncbi:MAG TPA: DUF6345 domain-containing protein [Phycisphaerae bacterium]